MQRSHCSVFERRRWLFVDYIDEQALSFKFLVVASAAALSPFILAGEDPQYTIENTVNAFEMGSVVKIRVGYKYWFAE